MLDCLGGVNTVALGILHENPDLRPDLVVFMDVTEEVAKQRGGFGEER